MTLFPRWTVAALAALSFSLPASAQSDHHHHQGEEELRASRWVQIRAHDKTERTAIANEGVSIEAVRSDSIWGFATPDQLRAIKSKGFQVLGSFDFTTGRGGHQGGFDFPAKDAKFHNYAEATSALRMLASSHADIARTISIGKTIEGRDIWAIHINTNPDALMSNSSSKPGILYVGNHHAREHLSVEVPLMFAQHLLKNRDDPKIWALLDSRDIWIIPMLNPDGSEFDIATGSYKYWRKNRRNNGDGTFGVDLNRNYSFGWGTGGSSKDTSSDVYMGPTPFSEPETIAIKSFVESQLNLKILLSFHTFSELILYPWGGKYDPIADPKDRAIHEKMATTMAGWNKYKPQQSSDLYIASGDTTDWAYGERGLVSFTFELSPANTGGAGGFYPGAGMIDKAFQDNLRPCLYLLDLTDDPGRATTTRPSPFLQNYVAPSLAPEHFWN
jgi:carboxypeptidase T